VLNIGCDFLLRIAGLRALGHERRLSEPGPTYGMPMSISKRNVVLERNVT